MEKLRLRRRLLREVVKENINVIQGHRPRSLRSSHRFLRTPSWTWQWVVISLSLLGSSYVISTIAADRRQVTPPVPPVSSAAAMHPPSLAANVAVSRGATFPAPQPIDPAVLPLGIHKIVVDPGHGGSDFGTIAPLGIVEKDVTLDIGLRLRHLLQKNSFRVSMTRETDKAVSLKERARFANAAGGDLFVSIHVNWIESRKIRGVETYYLGSTDDPFLTRLAAMENNESG